MPLRKTKVVVFILNFNKKDDLLACLETVHRQSLSPDEVVISDNGSCDGSCEAVRRRFPKVHIIENKKNLGICKGRNTGLQYATQNFDYDYLLSLDNDTLIDADYIQHLAEVMDQDTSAGIAYGKTYTRYPSKTIMSVGITTNFYTGYLGDIGAGEQDHGQYEKIKYVDACGGFGLMIRREAVIRSGGFNEAMSFYGWDDIEFCFRIRQLGYHIVYTPAAILYHKGTKQGRPPLPEYEGSKVENYLFLLKQYTNPLQKACSLIYIPLWAVFHIYRMITKGKVNIVGAHLKGFLNFVLKHPRVATGVKGEVK